MMKLTPGCVFLVCATVAAPAPAWSQGVISGHVVDESGTGIAGVEVVYNRLTDLQRDQFGGVRVLSPIVSDSVRSGLAGTFNAGSLPPGEYYVCALSPSSNYIGSCEWNSPSVKVPVANGKTVDAQLQLRRGRRVVVRVADERTNKDGDTILLVGVMNSDGYYQRAELVNASQNQRIYAVTVPAEAQPALFLDGDTPVYDSNGRAVAFRSREVTVPPSGNGEVVVNLTLR